MERSESSLGEPSPLRFGPFEFDIDRRLLSRDGQEVRLGSRPMDILIALCEDPGRLVSPQELISRAWPISGAFDANLRTQLFTLRKALGDGDEGQRYIQNVPGRGYRFIHRLEKAEEEPDEKTVPVDLAAFSAGRAIGRDEIITTLVDRLPHRRLITLVGPGGMGKTTVASCVADLFRASRGDDVHWVDFSLLAEDDSPAEMVALAVGLTNFASDHTPALISWLKPKRTLLVFDCCDRVVEATAILAERILAETSNIMILATSREVLRAAGEQIVRLPPLQTPEAEGLTADQALTFPSIQLFVDRAAAALGGFTLRDADVPYVVRICSRLDGIALAIEMAAGHLVAIKLRTLAALLDDKFRLVATGRRTALARHQTMRTVVDWSYEKLSSAERTVLQGLSVFENDIGILGLKALLTDHALETADLTAAATSLVDKSMALAKVTSDGVRYTLLETTRDYALAKLAESGELTQLSRRHAEHCLWSLQWIEAQTHGYQVAEWFGIRRRVLADLRAALNWVYADDDSAPLRLPLSVAGVRILFDLFLAEQCRRRGVQALTWLRDSGTQAPSTELQLRALMSLGSYHSPGPTTETMNELEALASLAEEVGDREYLPISLWGLWSVSMFHNNSERALAYADRFIAISGGMPEEVRDLLYLRMSGMALHIRGEHAEASLRLERLSSAFDPSLHVWNHLRQANQGVMAGLYLGRIHWIQGQHDRAVHDIREGLDALTKQNHAIALCHVFCEISIPLYQLSGDTDAAKADLARLLTLADEHGLTIFQAASRCIEAAFAAQDGTGDLASCRTAMEALRACRYNAPIPWLSGFLGEIALRRGDVDCGVTLVEACLNSAQDPCPAWWRPELLRVRAHLATASRSSVAEASAYLREALSLARDQGALFHELRIILARIHLRCPDASASDLLADLRELLRRFPETHRTRDMDTAYRMLE